MTEYDEGTQVAGRFVILESLGEGGMGAVYRALQTSLDREVALKLLHSQVAFTPRARRRFGREARAVARLNHPHIAGVFDFGTDNDDQTLWLAMELVEGASMTGLKRQDIDVLRLLSVTDQILSALSAAHARGIIHRDLKPSNVLLSVDDETREVIKLVDFGLAATQEGELSLENAPGGLDQVMDTSPGSRVIMGTPRYMAPEIFRRKPVDPRVDLYAMGVILFEILAGRPPYPGDDPRIVMRGHLKQPIPKLEARPGIEVPTELERIIYKLLAKDPDERFQTATEVREAIQLIISDYSFVPWMTGPAMGNLSGFGNVSSPGFLSAFGGQTIPPAAMTAGSRPGLGSAPMAPLVGRQAERRLIEQQIRRCVSEGHGGIVTVEGEGGVGKSRLAQWIRVRVEEGGLMRAAEGQYTRNGGGFDGIRSVLDGLLGTGEVTYDEIGLVIENRLSRWDFALDEIQTCIELMKPGGEAVLFDGSGSVSDTRISKQERVFAVIERIMRRASRERPLLLLLENLHNAGDTTFAFLEHLAVGLHMNPEPILFVSTLNSDEAVSLVELKEALARLGRFGTDLTRVKLERLDEDHATTLVQKLLPLDESIARPIAERSGGNPLHLMQILRYLQESEKLKFVSGTWTLAAGVNIHTEVPEELGEMMRYRAERMISRFEEPDAISGILERCAILGRRFDYRMIRGFLETEGDPTYNANLDAALEFLVKEGMFREVGHTAEDVLEFNHAMLRDVLLKDTEQRRSARALHRIAAEVKVAFYQNRVNQHGLEIAEHYRRARDPQGVYIYTVKAARSAMSSSDLGTAIRLYREAMDLAEQDGHIDEGLKQTENLHEISSVMRSQEVALEIAHIELKIGEYAQAREHYRELLRSEDRITSAWARWGLGQLALRQGELEEAVGWFDATQREAQILSREGFEVEASRVQARCLFGQGTIHFLRGEFTEASKVLPKALEKAQKEKERVFEGEILRTLSDVVWATGDPDKAEIYRRRSTLLAESHGDQEALAHTMLHAATYLRQIGQPAKAEEQVESALERFESLGKRHSIANGMLVLGHIAWCRGDYKRAASHYREAHRLFEAYEDRRGTTECKLRLAELALSIKKYKETQTLLRDALEGFRAMGDRRGVAFCKMLLGRLQLCNERVEQAEAHFREVGVEFGVLGDVASRLLAMTYDAVALEHLKRHDEVDAILEEVFDAVRSMPMAYESFATALDELSGLLNTRRPDLAIETDNLAGEAWQMLGRAVRVSSTS